MVYYHYVVTLPHVKVGKNCISKGPIPQDDERDDLSSIIG